MKIGGVWKICSTTPGDDNSMTEVPRPRMGRPKGEAGLSPALSRNCKVGCPARSLMCCPVEKLPNRRADPLGNHQARTPASVLFDQTSRKANLGFSVHPAYQKPPSREQEAFYFRKNHP